jgi:hypothetical protein
MGDLRRFTVFADFIAEHVRDRSVRIADVAAGKGALTWALRERGFRHIVPFEPAPRRGGQVTRLGMQVRDFRPELAEGFDLLVGMHPDAATDCILDGAARSGASVVVSPCCVRPNVWTYWGSRRSHRQWHDHLVLQAARRGLRLQTDRLRMTGANAVMWGGSLVQGKGEG